MFKQPKKKELCNLVLNQLKERRQPFLEIYKDIEEYILPGRARFTLNDTDKGPSRSSKIIDSSGTAAANTLRAGMMSGITSPARPWFRLSTDDDALAESGRVKAWLFQVQNIMTTTLLKSNLYNTLSSVYGDLGSFGTAPFSIVEDFNGAVLHTDNFLTGSYMIGKSSRGKVNVFAREYQVTVRELVEEFGKPKNGKADWSNFSQMVKDNFEKGNYETKVSCVHMIMPNSEFMIDSPWSKNMRFAEYYYEAGVSVPATSDVKPEDLFLAEKGYKYFPVLGPRWETNGESAYAVNCPGIQSLGDIKQLQHGELKSLIAVDKMVDPPMVGSTALRTSGGATMIPGEITWLDETEGMKSFRPAYEIDFRIDLLEQKQEKVRSRISKNFYEDLFLMLANSDRRQITATEIAERKEEKLLALGPVLEQLNSDVLDPLIDITFDLLVRQGRLPEVPDELQGVDLKIEYTSVMAQAQKLVGLGTTDRFLQTVQQVIAVDPSAKDKIDFDQVIDVYAEITGVAPKIVRTDEEVAEIRKVQADQARQQNNMQAIQSGSQSAKNLSQADTSGENALTNLMSMAGGQA